MPLSFSSTFQFRMSNLRVSGADGIVFTIAPSPPALAPFFGLFEGVWNRDGFLPRDEWFGILAHAGFYELQCRPLLAGQHDLGGLIWGVK